MENRDIQSRASVITQMAERRIRLTGDCP